MNYFKKWNLIMGWAAFAIAALAYIATTEPTASLWDCSEFIATSYKLEVGHPPGAPLFMMIARFFTIFAPDTASVPFMVNLMSCLCGAFTVLFLFWSITLLARKVYAKGGKELTAGQAWTVIGAGLIGSIAYCFTDTQWFSAVEGEVYSMSSMFTALVFWAILQWESVADKPHANRWLILIAYIMGLSIGVHILNLLVLPAIVFVYYFKKYPQVTKWGVVLATLIAGALIVAINYVLVPWTVAIGAFVDRVFVNSFGLPINVGLTLTFAAFFVLAGWLVWYTHKRGKVLANTIVLCASVIMLGYSSYASVIIRANANPPMNSNNPNNPYALLALLNRDQYGSRPLLYGPYYSSPRIDFDNKESYYVGDDGKYQKAVTGIEDIYPNEYKYLFPRMYSAQDKHVQGYYEWGRVVGRKTMYGDELITVPTFGENLRYFFSYQLNFMYWRYFLWNFAGRQSDIQSTGEITNGNWLSGIKFIDELYLGPQDNLPTEMQDNKGRNTYFFLPFILGIIGLIFHLNRDAKGFTTVMWVFLMTGIVLVLYFNTTPGEPRERDYVYAGSFYAFCVWIGLGVLAVRDFLLKLTKKDSVAIAAVSIVVCSCVPLILVAQNWDDHDRSGRYVARDIGWNYLNSTLPNSIIMNYGDNDTFPLWYNQEVEGVRMDVRIMNMSYIRADWYIDQMKLRSNESDPVPLSLPRNKYVNMTNELLPVRELVSGYRDIRQVMAFVRDNDPRTQQEWYFGKMDIIPTKHIAIPVNKENALACGIVKPEDAELMVDTMYITLSGSYLDKSDLVLFDVLANFDWKRPLYFTQPYYLDKLSGDLTDYLQFDGYAYRLVPIKTKLGNDVGRVDTEYLYKNIMETFRYGNIADPNVYCDNFSQISLNAANSRSGFARLALGLIEEGDTTRAVKVLDTAVEKLPFKQLRHSYYQTLPLIEGYYSAKEYDKGNAILEDYARVLQEHIAYYSSFPDHYANLVSKDLEQKVLILGQLRNMADHYEQDDQAQAIEAFFKQIGA